MTEPYSPSQNESEHLIHDLGSIRTKNVKEFNVPLNHHHWHMESCKDAYSVLSMEKLDYRVPKEVLTGGTPDVFVLNLHVWEDTFYLDPDAKQPKNSVIMRKFLGISWNYGDSLCYFITISLTEKKKNDHRRWLKVQK